MSYESIDDNGEEIKTKRNWNCEWCGQKILRGERAIKRIYKWDGYLNNARQHAECFNAMRTQIRDEEFELNHMNRPKPEGN
jgi:DNA-directed RNA polymerase subunit RPC12/RpoP